MKIDRLSLGSGILIGIGIGLVIGIILPIALNPLLVYKTIKINKNIPQTITVGTKDLIIKFWWSDYYYNNFFQVQSGSQSTSFQVAVGGTYGALGIEIKVLDFSQDGSIMTLQYKPAS